MPPPTPPLIVAEGLGKEYRSPARFGDVLAGRLRGAAVPALHDVSLAAEVGEIVAVLGGNGAGKSTLLKCLAGMVTPSRGRFAVAGHDASSPALRRDAVYVGGDARSFAWRLSGRQNLEFFAALHGMDRAAARVRTSTVLERVGLTAAADRRVAEYSTGMRQRLSLARGFLGTPRVLLLDEPTAGIDPKSAGQLRQLIRELAGRGGSDGGVGGGDGGVGGSGGGVGRGVTVLVATHQLEEVRELATRAVVLAAGRVVYDGAVSGAVEAALG